MSYRIYEHAPGKNWLYGLTMFIVAEINWDYSHEFSDDYPDDWDDLKKLGYVDHHDAAIHCWLKKYRRDMYDWLTERKIKWRGIQSGDEKKTTFGVRGFMVVCVGLQKPEHITEFVLTWG